jgi:glycosyltransferase involved in cell wall biosynthesis
MSNFFGRRLTTAPRMIRALDRKLFYRFGRKLVSKLHPSGNGRASLKGIDVFHHVELPLFPPDAFPTNVMTIPDLTTLRHPEFHEAANVELFQEIHDYAPQMDMIITESEHTKRDVVALLGIAPDRIRVTPLAAHEQYRPMNDQDQLQRTLERHALKGRPYILTVGTLEPRKNHTRLIEAFGLLKRGGDLPNHSLVMVGGKGWIYDSVFETVRRLGLEADVRWLGYVPFDDLPALLSGADLFVYPSLYEGFGLPPLEAMACGAAVVASNTTSLPEVVDDAGLLVDPTNTDEIAAAMHRILKDDNLRRSLRKTAVERARTFTWDRTARLTFDAYDEARRRSQDDEHKRPTAQLQSRSRDHVRTWVREQLKNTYGC